MTHASRGPARVHAQSPTSTDRGEGDIEVLPHRGLLVRLLRLLLVLACCFGALQFLSEMVAWVNRARVLAGESDDEKRKVILGDLAPFLEEAARQIPERASVLLVTNELPWRARYLLLPRTVYTYEGPVAETEGLGARVLAEEAALLARLDISWVVSYVRSTSGTYRIIDSDIIAVRRMKKAPVPSSRNQDPGERVPRGQLKFRTGGWRRIGT